MPPVAHTFELILYLVRLFGLFTSGTGGTCRFTTRASVGWGSAVDVIGIREARIPECSRWQTRYTAAHIRKLVIPQPADFRPPELTKSPNLQQLVQLHMYGLLYPII